ncbi:hypothetical protein B0H14DRAFT_3501574 [Mycena olivaceomarginata]|nr:hypothetical protein B0H14DRAFT_3501574 [Mycena olivaceomarginata]
MQQDAVFVGTLQPPASIHFVHYEAEVKGHGEISREVPLRKFSRELMTVKSRKRPSRIQQLAACSTKEAARVSPISFLCCLLTSRPTLSKAAPARATTPSTYANTPYPLVLGFHRSSSVGFFFEADTGLSGTKDATVPEDLRLFSDLPDKIRAGWCRIYATGGGFVNTIACAPVGRNFAAFAAGLGSFLLHRPRRRLGAGASLADVFTTYATRTSSCELANLAAVHAGTQPAARAGDPRRERHVRAVPYAGGAGEGGTRVLFLIGDSCVHSLLLPPPSSFSSSKLSWWAARNGCMAANTTETPFDGDVHHSSWACAEGESVLQHGRYA